MKYILLFLLAFCCRAVAVRADEPAAATHTPAAVFPRPDGRPKIFSNGHIGMLWTPSGGGHEPDMTTIHGGLGILLPGGGNGLFEKSFFALTPILSYTHIEWPEAVCFPDALYTASLPVTWRKSLNGEWSLMLTLSPTYAADGHASNDAFRCNAIAGATWMPNEKWKLLLGLAYMDRADIPVLPLAGATYTPNDDWTLELVIPQPRASRRLNSLSSARREIWMYLGAGFGEGSWAVDSVENQDDLAMFKGYSVLLGVEALDQSSKARWVAELAWLFNREIEFDRRTQPDIDLDDTFSIRLRYSF